MMMNTDTEEIKNNLEDPKFKRLVDIHIRLNQAFGELLDVVLKLQDDIEELKKDKENE